MVKSLIYGSDGCSRFFRNVATWLPTCMSSYPKREIFCSLTPREIRIWFCNSFFFFIYLTSRVLSYGPMNTESFFVLFQVSNGQNWRHKPGFSTRCKVGYSENTETQSIGSAERIICHGKWMYTAYIVMYYSWKCCMIVSLTNVRSETMQNLKFIFSDARKLRDCWKFGKYISN